MDVGLRHRRPIGAGPNAPGRANETDAGMGVHSQGCLHDGRFDLTWWYVWLVRVFFCVCELPCVLGVPGMLCSCIRSLCTCSSRALCWRTYVGILACAGCICKTCVINRLYVTYPSRCILARNMPKPDVGTHVQASSVLSCYAHPRVGVRRCRCRRLSARRVWCAGRMVPCC